MLLCAAGLYLAPGSGRPGSTPLRQHCWRWASRCRAACLRRAAAGSAPWGSRSSTPAPGSLPRETPAMERKQISAQMPRHRQPVGNAPVMQRKINLHKPLSGSKRCLIYHCKAHFLYRCCLSHCNFLKNGFKTDLVKLENSQCCLFIIHKNTQFDTVPPVLVHNCT